jgi:AraC family transcriptional regulator, transcriptional activator of pobA
MAQTSIPDYFVYGEPVRALDVGFMHVELVSARKSLHRGHVIAHKHPQMAQITYWTKGGGTYQIEDRSWSFSAPAASYVPSNVVHGFDVSSTSDAIVVSVANDALAGISGALEKLRPEAVFVHDAGAATDWTALDATMKLLSREYQQPQASRQHAMLHLVGLASLYIARKSGSFDATNLAPHFPLALRLRHLVDLHFRDNWKIERFARELRSTQHLIDKAAHAGFGVPTKQLLTQRRMLEARRLLQFTIRPVEDIAYELGFKDPAYFNREFKKSTGDAPGVWRAKALRPGLRPELRGQ